MTGKFEIGDYRTSIDLSSSATGTLTRVKNAIAKLDDVVVRLQQRRTQTETEIEQKAMLIAKPNPQVDEYHQKQKRLDEIADLLAEQAIQEVVVGEVAEG